MLRNRDALSQTRIATQSTTLVNSTLAGQIASRQVLRYASYVWDTETGLYYYREGYAPGSPSANRTGARARATF